MTNSCLNDVPVVLVLLWVPQSVLLEVHLEKKGPQAIQANQMLSSVLVSIAPKLLLALYTTVCTKRRRRHGNKAIQLHNVAHCYYGNQFKLDVTNQRGVIKKETTRCRTSTPGRTG